MLRKMIVLVMVAVVMLLAGTCWANEKPIGDITDNQQVIDKLFTGKTLDPIEGIWVKDGGTVIAIVKTSLVNIKAMSIKNMTM